MFQHGRNRSQVDLHVQFFPIQLTDAPCLAEGCRILFSVRIRLTQSARRPPYRFQWMELQQRGTLLDGEFRDPVQFVDVMERQREDKPEGNPRGAQRGETGAHLIEGPRRIAREVV